MTQHEKNKKGKLMFTQKLKIVSSSGFLRGYKNTCTPAQARIRYESFKGSSDPSHFIFEINVGKGRIRLFPILISKIYWLGFELPLKSG